MIEIEKAKQVFEDYLKNYQIEEKSIKAKITHTYGVMKMSEFLARYLNLDEESINLAKVIALLHDIGRFEQRSKLREFEDYKGLDHAEYGLKVLFEDGWIRKFIKEEQYDFIIYQAIKNHNQYQIEDRLDKFALLQVKIIRDADKLDNFRVKSTEEFQTMFHYCPDTILYETISPKIYQDFMNHKQINVQERVTQIDIWISYIAFIFDLNFDISSTYLLKHDYINRLVDRIEYRNEDTKKKMEEIRICANEYLKEKMRK